ncbi:hypothetical protein CPter291_4958 [Collimonas pratensis]|uniref:Uncharacterized protein n=1 Tax=Collimonas pratensis TaxID=279113 RepID=A0A127QBR7_9BURK|nr:hypothetical protein CPter91_5148 [Collimonas pratensis]AMP17171.1 hypothetical protein CPter291_4958 [Collimonas pratensis]
MINVKRRQRPGRTVSVWWNGFQAADPLDFGQDSGKLAGY